MPTLDALGGGEVSVTRLLAQAPVPPPFATFCAETAVNAHPLRGITVKRAVSGWEYPLTLTETVPLCTAVPDQEVPGFEEGVTWLVPSEKLQLDSVAPVGSDKVQTTVCPRGDRPLYPRRRTAL